MNKPWTWAGILVWMACFFVLPGFLMGLLHQQHLRQLTQTMPKISVAPAQVAPVWVPLRENFRVEQSYIGESSGHAVMWSEESIDAMVTYFESRFREAGFEVSTNRMHHDNAIVTAILSASHSVDGRHALLTLSQFQQGARVELAFSEGK